MEHEKPIEIRWRDLGADGHVDQAAFLTYLEEVRDEWLGRVLGDPAQVWGYVVARIVIDFRRRLDQGDDVVLARCRLERLGTSSLHTREQILTRAGELAADAEAVLVAWDAAAGRPRPLSEGERAALERAS